MRLGLHPKVSSDLQAIMEYYRGAAGPALADEYFLFRIEGAVMRVPVVRHTGSGLPSALVAGDHCPNNIPGAPKHRFCVT